MKIIKLSIFVLFLAALTLGLTACGSESGGGGTTATATGNGDNDGAGHEGHDKDSDQHADNDKDGDEHNHDATETSASVDRKKSPASKPRPRPSGSGSGSPKISFPSHRHDFGNIYEGTEVTHEFTVKNDGDGPLVISRVKASCGCTVPTKPEEAIEPGDTAQIKVIFNSKKRKGEQKKDISVFSNDPERPMMKLQIQANVIRQFWVDPERLYLGSLTKSQELEQKTLKVRWSEEVDVNVTNVTSSNPAIQIDRKPFTDERGSGVELNVKFVGGVAKLTQGAAGAPMQRISEVITVETDNPNFAKTPITINGNIIPEVTMRPRVLSFGVFSRDAKPVTKKVILTAARDFELSKPTVSSDLEFVEFEITEIRAGKQYQILAKLNPAAAPEGQFRKSITVKTNSGEFTDMKIPVFGKIKP